MTEALHVRRPDERIVCPGAIAAERGVAPCCGNEEHRCYRKHGVLCLTALAGAQHDCYSLWTTLFSPDYSFAPDDR